MQNNVTGQLIEFLNFVFIGIILALIFDFFRAYRKYKKVSSKGVVFQDILYFIIASGIITFSIIYILDSNIRLYIFLGIILGITTYIGLLSSYFLKIYDLILNIFFGTISFIFLPIILNFTVISIIVRFFKKYIGKCCKKFFYMISLVHKRLNFTKVRKICVNKRGLFCMKNKENKNKTGKLKFSIIIPLIFVGYCGYTLFEQQMQINKYDSQIKLYETQIEEKNELVEYYNTQKDNVNSDEYIEKVAREALGLVKPYEKIFIDANK